MGVRINPAPASFKSPARKNIRKNTACHPLSEAVAGGIMPKIIQQAWLSFGHLLDLSPRRSNTGVQIREWRRELAKRGDGNALADDYRRVGHDIKLAMNKYNG